MADGERRRSNARQKNGIRPNVNRIGVGLQDGLEYPCQCCGNKGLHIGKCRIVEGLVAQLGMRAAQTGLLLVQAGVQASGHAGASIGRHGYVACERDVEIRARVSRYGKLHEQHAEQRDKRGDQAGWAGQIHYFLRFAQFMVASNDISCQAMLDFMARIGHYPFSKN